MDKQSVRLRSGTGLSSYGSLNTIFLAEEGYMGGLVPVVCTRSGFAVVRLPSGYLLNVWPQDIQP